LFGVSTAKTKAKMGEFSTKSINFGGVPRTILLQDQNGPCPLIALTNCLSLCGEIELPLPIAHSATAAEYLQRAQYGAIDGDLVYTILGEKLWKYSNRFLETFDSENANQNPPDSNVMNDEFKEKPVNLKLENARFEITRALDMLPSLRMGLNLNVKFDRIDGFEYTPELSVFDLSSVRVVHGWLIDPEKDKELLEIVQKKSYNQIVEEMTKILHDKAALLKRAASQEEDDGKWAEHEAEERKLKEEDPLWKFLNDSSTQLTEYGLYKLKEEIPNHTLVILFRNNHFSTVLKKNNQLYVLVTDNLLARQDRVCWESLTKDGDSVFYDSTFKLSSPKRVQSAPEVQTPPPAILHANLSDRSLAHRLQMEEQEKADLVYAQELQSEAYARALAAGTKDKKKDKKDKKKQPHASQSAPEVMSESQNPQPPAEPRPKTSIFSRIGAWCRSSV
jgi:hypothetical protein